MAEDKWVSAAEAILPYQPRGNETPRTRAIQQRAIEKEQEEADRAAATTAVDQSATSGLLSGFVSPGEDSFLRDAFIGLTEVGTELGDAFSTNNLAVGAGRRVLDAVQNWDLSSEPDTSGWYATNYEKYTNGFTAYQQEQIADTENPAQADRLAAHFKDYNDKIRRMSNRGTSQNVANLASMFLDVDALVPLFGTAVKAGRLASGIAKGTVASGAAGGAVETARALVNRQEIDSAAVVSAIIMNGALGTTVAAYRGVRAERTQRINELMRQMQEAADATVKKAGDDWPDVWPGTGPATRADTAPKNPMEDDLGQEIKKSREAAEKKTEDVFDDEGSIGSARLKDAVDYSEEAGEKVVTAAEEAAEFLRTEKIHASTVGGKVRDAAENLVTSDKAKWVYDMLPKSLRQGMMSDFERVFNSPSRLAKKLAVTLFEDPTKRVAFGASAAVMDDAYARRILSAYIPGYTAQYKQWTRSIGATWKDKYTSNKLEEDFGRQTVLEMNHRRLYAESMPDVNPFVKAAADELQKGSDVALSVAKGLPGQKAVDGMENVDGGGYLTVVWKADVFRAALKNGHTEEDLVALFADGYKGALPELDDAKRELFARAIVSRMLRRADGSDDSLVNILSSDGRVKIRDELVNNGYADADIDALIQRLSGNLEDKKREGFTKRRTEIDMSVTRGDLRVIDFVDTNVVRVTSRYARNVAGRSALARKGITNSAERDEFIQMVLDEQLAVQSGITQQAKAGLQWAEAQLNEPFPKFKKDPKSNVSESTQRRRWKKEEEKFRAQQEKLVRTRRKRLEAALREAEEMEKNSIDREFLEDMFTYFGGGPIGGGVSDLTRRLKQFTTLSLMSQLGIPQAAETGALIAASGVDSFIETSPAVSKLLKRDGYTEEVRDKIIEEFEPWLGKIGQEHNLMRDDLALDYARTDLMEDGVMGALDYWMGKGLRIQGFISGFYTIRGMQHKQAVVSMANKVAKMMRDGVDEVGGARLDDIGIHSKDLEKVRKEIMEHAEWSGPDKQGFATALNMDKWDPEIAEKFSFAMNTHTHQVVQKAMAGEEFAWMHKDVGTLLSQYRTFPLVALRKQVARNVKFGDDAIGGVVAASLATASLAYITRQVINNDFENLTPFNIAMGTLNLSNATSAMLLPVGPLSTLIGIDDRYGNPGIVSAPALDTINRSATRFGNITEGDIGGFMRAIPVIGNAVGFRALFDAMRD